MDVGFSVKTAVLVLVFGVVIAAAFSFHRLQPQAHKTCNYKNWAAPCRTSGWHVDWTDVSAFVIAGGAAIAGGLIVGSRNRKRSTAAAARVSTRPVETAHDTTK
jgi:ribose/xylose/arabinose/galactoside ABC-type transport system permease subunit